VPIVRGEKSSHHSLCCSSADHQQRERRRSGSCRPSCHLLSVRSQPVKRGSTYISVSVIRRGLVVCLLRSSAILQNHEVVSSRHVRRHGFPLAPDAVPDVLQGLQWEELSPSACNLHLHNYTHVLSVMFSSVLVHTKVN
jgi:hypothetical protein